MTGSIHSASGATQEPCSVARWHCGNTVLNVEQRPLLMGILNVTPDSFSDGGLYIEPARALERAMVMISEGADIIDIGGESSRPGALRVPAAEEMRRVLPVVKLLCQHTRVPVSVDTMRASVAAAILAEGACIINDISACTADSDMPRVVARSGCGVVLMHMRGEPSTMQMDPVYTDITREVRAWLAERMEAMIGAGVSRECLVVDPGIGFGKKLEHNLALLSRLDALVSLKRPLLVGLSRKSFVGAITGGPPDARLGGSLAATAFAILKGARIVRTHDVKETCDLIRMLARLDIAL